MHQLYLLLSSTLDNVGSKVVGGMHGAAGCVCAQMQIPADQVTLSIGWPEKLISSLAASLAKVPKRRRLE